MYKSAMDMAMHDLAWDRASEYLRPRGDDDRDYDYTSEFCPLHIGNLVA